MTSDTELLRTYARDRSDNAFTELVQRHINLVYSAGLRETRGDSAMAGDITQAVFVHLAQRASKLCRHPALAGWLYTSVRRLSANRRRQEDRRQRREHQAQIMNESHASKGLNSGWNEIQPVLDDAMHELSTKDRTAIVLRFFEERTFKEVGLALGVTENTARMRVNRALERLQGVLAKHGVTSTASGLAGAVSAGAVLSAPAALALSVANGALVNAATTTSTLITVLNCHC